MANNRVFYPIHYVAIGTEGQASGTPVHGVQSVSTTTTFNLEQVFELGQLEIYENIENLPSIEMTVEKVLDGYPLIYHLASPDATSATLLNRTAGKCDIILSVFSDLQDNASGTPLVQAYCSGMYINSLNYTLPVQGNCRESLSFVGNDKSWKTSNFYFNGHFDGTDAAPSGVQRRQDVLMGTGNSIWPELIPGIDDNGYNPLTAGNFEACIQDVTISTSLGREDIFELGRRKPFYKYARFPTAVDCSITTLAHGDQPADMVAANSDTDNLSNETINIILEDGTRFNLGDRNKLQSVTYSGGEAGGDNVSITFNFQNFNRLDITHPADPANQ